MLCTFDEVLFSLQEEGNSDTCYNMGERGGHCSKWNKPVTKGQVLYDSVHVWYLKLSN